MRRPNFLIIGAAKSGTTALHSYLRQHPQIFMPEKKELNYFSPRFANTNVPKIHADEVVDTLDEYESYFAGVTIEKAIGEATPTYLYYEKTPERIKALIPDVKLIAILRNPIERAYSAYLHAIRDWREPAKDFYEALALEPERIKQNWSILYHYITVGLYSEQVDRYFFHFPKDKIKTFLYDDLLNNPQELFQEIFRFLDVDPDFTPDITHRPNVSGKIKNTFLHTVMENLFMKRNPIKSISRIILPKKLRQATTTSLRAMNMEKHKIPDEYRMHLKPFFVEDMTKLQELLRRDLSAWMK